MMSGARTGRRLVNSLLGVLALLFALVAVPVAGVALHQPAWIIGSFLAVVVLLLFAEGSYEEWRHAERERVRLADVIDEERSRNAVAARLDDFAEEFAALRDAIPPDPTGAGPTQSQDQLRWSRSVDHLIEMVNSELRRNAKGFLAYWGSNPEPIPELTPFVPYAEALAGLSVKQLRSIADQLRAGHDSP